MRCEVPGEANVLSERTKPKPDPRVVAWLRAHEPEIAVDPVIPGELRFGILILPNPHFSQPCSGKPLWAPDCQPYFARILLTAQILRRVGRRCVRHAG
jgi:hypothetical protein